MKFFLCLLLFFLFLNCKAVKDNYEIANTNTRVEYFENGNVKNVGNIYVEKLDNPTNESFTNLYKPRVGFWNEFYDNGQLKESGNYKLAIYKECGAVPFDAYYSYKFGEWIYFYKNGKIKAKGTYEIGKKNRVTNCAGGFNINFGYVTEKWKFFDENGKEVKPNFNDINEIEKSSYIAELDMLK